MVLQMGWISIQVWCRHQRRLTIDLLIEPPVYSVLPSNTLVYAIEKLLASTSRLVYATATLIFLQLMRTGYS